MQNSDFWTRIANLYGSQISPAVLFLQCSVSSNRNTSLHGSQPSCVAFGCNRATFGPEKQVSISPRHNLSLCACKIAWLAPELLFSMCPNPHLWFCAFKTATLWSQLLVSMGLRPHLWFSACKTACLASELLVSMDPSPHLWFLHAKQRLLYPNSKSLCVPDITCSFVPPMPCD